MGIDLFYWEIPVCLPDKRLRIVTLGTGLMKSSSNHVVISLAVLYFVCAPLNGALCLTTAFRYESLLLLNITFTPGLPFVPSPDFKLSEWSRGD